MNATPMSVMARAKSAFTSLRVRKAVMSAQRVAARPQARPSIVPATAPAAPTVQPVSPPNATSPSAILDPFEWFGVNSFGDNAVILRARIKTIPGKQWSIGRAYNGYLKTVFDDRKIEIPLPNEAQRLDILLRMPPQGALPVLAQVEGLRVRTGFVLAPPGAAIARVAAGRGSRVAAGDTTAPGRSPWDVLGRRPAIRSVELDPEILLRPARVVARRHDDAAIGPAAEVLAISEGLEAHGLSVRARLDKINSK